MLDEVKSMFMDYYKTIDCSVSFAAGGAILHVDSKRLASIVSMFSESAVYEREDWGPIAGKNAIGEFFLNKRALQGEHQINREEITQESGVPPAIKSKVLSHFPEIDPGSCSTIVVTGTFRGDHCVTDEIGCCSEDRRVKIKNKVTLDFKDYWVLADSHVVFRLSKISPKRDFDSKEKIMGIHAKY